VYGFSTGSVGSGGIGDSEEVLGPDESVVVVVGAGDSVVVVWAGDSDEVLGTGDSVVVVWAGDSDEVLGTDDSVVVVWLDGSDEVAPAGVDDSAVVVGAGSAVVVDDVDDLVVVVGPTLSEGSTVSSPPRRVIVGSGPGSTGGTAFLPMATQVCLPFTTAEHPSLSFRLFPINPLYIFLGSSFEIGSVAEGSTTGPTPDLSTPPSKRCSQPPRSGYSSVMGYPSPPFS